MIAQHIVLAATLDLTNTRVPLGIPIGKFGLIILVVAVQRSRIELICGTRVVLGACRTARAVVPVDVELLTVGAAALDVRLILKLLAVVDGRQFLVSVFNPGCRS